MGSQTGPASPWGAAARGADFYFKMINDQGGVHGRSVTHRMFDDSFQPARTLAGVRELVEVEDVFAFVGGIGAAGGRAVMNGLTARGIPWVSPGSGAIQWTQPLKKNIFAVIPPARDQASLLAWFAVRIMQREKIAIIFQDDDHGRGLQEGARLQLESHALKPALEIPVKADDPDLKSVISRLKEAGPEVVIVSIIPAQAVILRKAARNFPFKPDWMTDCSLSDARLMYKMTEGLWEGTVFTSYLPPPESRSAALTRYRNAFHKYALKGERWGTFFYSGIAWAEPLVEALQRCGRNPTREALIRELEGMTNFQGIMGPIRFGPDDHLGFRQLYLAETIKKGDVRQRSGWLRSQLPPYQPPPVAPPPVAPPPE